MAAQPQVFTATRVHGPNHGHTIRGRMWCFTLPADEAKGEHLSWPTANARDPPLHWGDMQDLKYMMYQVKCSKR